MGEAVLTVIAWTTLIGMGVGAVVFFWTVFREEVIEPCRDEIGLIKAERAQRAAERVCPVKRRQ